ncbi:MAG: sigma-70 family RNA polymerase sigma factor [Paludibacter sp.]|nr:sigma-70 family RNA polymerase sigma factor [Paludibacter sp.]
MLETKSIEKQYILELKRGSYKAFDIIYSMYVQRLYGFIFKLTKSEEETKEIVQETFVKLWTSRDNISTETSFQSYLFTIAKNSAINKFRATVNSPVFVDYIHYLNEDKLSENNIAQLLDYDDFRSRLEHAKKYLSNSQLNIFELCKELGYTNADAAEKLNLSEQTIKNQLSAALKILREKMSSSAFLFAIFFL